MKQIYKRLINQLRHEEIRLIFKIKLILAVILRDVKQDDLILSTQHATDLKLIASIDRNSRIYRRI